LRGGSHVTDATGANGFDTPRRGWVSAA
jgi:hypothetical protein